MPTIKVADFTEFPGGRFVIDGPFSGELYRNEVLVPALLAAMRAGEVLTVELDGTKGYGSSFLEEAFGGMIRHGLVRPSDAKTYLSVVARSRLYEPYQRLTNRYLAAARPSLAVA